MPPLRPFDSSSTPTTARKRAAAFLRSTMNSLRECVPTPCSKVLPLSFRGLFSIDRFARAKPQPWSMKAMFSSSSRTSGPAAGGSAAPAAPTNAIAISIPPSSDAFMFGSCFLLLRSSWRPWPRCRDLSFMIFSQLKGPDPTGTDSPRVVPPTGAVFKQLSVGSLQLSVWCTRSWTRWTAVRLLPTANYQLLRQSPLAWFGRRCTMLQLSPQRRAAPAAPARAPTIRRIGLIRHIA